MKREILFRGKRFDNGEWITGLMLKCTLYTGTAYLIFGDSFATDLLGNVHALAHAMVDPDTVGQYTGRTDMNGVKIFEGDILEFVEESGAVYHDEVIWYDMMSGFKCKTKGGHLLTLFDEIAYRGLVIGNIYDNPELI